jgi:hypothetical protein
VKFKYLIISLIVGSAIFLLPLASFAYNEALHAESTEQLLKTHIGPLPVIKGPVDEPLITPVMKRLESRKRKGSKFAAYDEQGHWPDKIDPAKYEELRRKLEELLKKHQVSHLLRPETTRSLGTKAGIAAAKAELRAAHKRASGDDKTKITKALNAIDPIAGQEQAMLVPARTKRALN